MNKHTTQAALGGGQTLRFLFKLVESGGGGGEGGGTEPGQGK